MARYGIDFYGVGHYGAAPLVQFDARPVEAISRDHAALTVTWQIPSGAWDLIRLVRDPYGYPIRYDEGTLLLESSRSGAPATYLDTGLVPGKFYYYTIWVRATADGLWREAGETIGLPVADYDSSGRLFELLPEFYRAMDGESQSAHDFGRGQLERFLDIPGFQTDHVHTEYETLRQTMDPDKVSGGMLPLMAKEWGLGWEPDLGMRLARIQLRNIAHIWKTKGSEYGIEAIASALTGWGATAYMGVNLMLDQNDSAAATSVGHWTSVANATIARDNSDAAKPVPPPGGASTGDIGSGAWYFTLTSTGAGDMVVKSHPNVTALDNRTLGIPVTAGLAYTYSLYTKAAAAPLTYKLGIQWFDRTGTSLGAMTESTTTAADSTSAWTRYNFTQTAPTNAAYALLQLRALTAAGAGVVRKMGAVQFEQAAAVSTYQAARCVRIKFDADRINLVHNASFETNTTGWGEGSGTGTVTRVAGGASAVYGTYVLRATKTSGAGTGGLGPYNGGSDCPPVTPGLPYTFSLYATKGTGVQTVGFSVTWLTAALASINTVSAPNVLLTTTPQRISLVGIVAPPTAAFAQIACYVAGASAINDYFDIDAVLIEQGQTLGTFFDGTFYSPEAEYVWAGTAGGSATHYYSRRLIKNFRLNQRMVEFLPASASYALLYATQT